MKPREWFQLDNLPQTILSLLAAAILYLAGLFSRGVYPLLQRLVQDMPKEVLTVGLILILLVLACVVGILVVTMDENTRLKQQPIWRSAYNANWKYLPASKRFEPWPHCRCCTPAKALLNRGKSVDTKVEILVCPSRESDISLFKRSQFYLIDTSVEPERFLTIQEALSKLTKEGRHV